MAVRRFRAVDIATLVYVGLASVAILRSFREDNVAGWPWLALAHGLLVILVLLAPRARTLGPVGRFLGDWYPMIVLAGLYSEIGVLNLDTAFLNDLAIQRLEEWMFGSQVSYRWIRETPNLLLSWVLHLCYLSYYPILYVAPLGLWIAGRRDAARQTILAMMATFFLCYLVFLFFPVAGPRYAFGPAQGGAAEVLPARVTAWILDRGDSWGAAFPSSHVAAAVVATGMAVRHWRTLGLAILPLATGLVFSVVYGQYHYAVDSVAGLGVAALILGVVQTADRRVPERVPVALGPAG